MRLSTALMLFLWLAITTSLRAERVALVIGVEDYAPTELRALKYAEDDATALANRLELMGFHVMLMTADQRNPEMKPSTPEKIVAALEGRLKGLSPRDTLVVALSGHGVQFSSDPVLKTGSRETYFCLESAKIANRSTLLPIQAEVLRRIDRCEAGRKLVLIDACRNEVSPKAGDLGPKFIPIAPQAENPRRMPKGMSVLFSCGSGEKSWEHDDLQHSVFSNFVLEYLSGKGSSDLYDLGQPDIDGLVTYVRRKTNRFVIDLTPTGQLPELVGDRESWPISEGITAKYFINSLGKKMIRVEGGTLLRDYDPKQVEIPTLLVAEKKVTVGDFKKFVTATGYKTVAELAAAGEKEKLIENGVPRNDIEERGISSFYGEWWNENYDPTKGYSTDNLAFIRDPKASWRNLSWPQTDEHPVMNLSSIDIQHFIAWLSKEEGRAYTVLDDNERDWIKYGNMPAQYAPQPESGPPQTAREELIWAELKEVISRSPPTNPNSQRPGSSYHELRRAFLGSEAGRSSTFGTVSTNRPSTHPSRLVGLFVNYPELHSNGLNPESNTVDCIQCFDVGYCFANLWEPVLAGFRLVIQP